MQRVALIGASNDPEKYSNKAFRLLRENGHDVFPVHPKLEVIDGVKVYRTLDEVPGPIDTVSLYVSKDISTRMIASIIQKAPKRIIFNPGAENPDLAKAAESAGIRSLEACTLVMLTTHQFEK